MNWFAFTKNQQGMIIGTVVLAIAQVFILIHFLGGEDSFGFWGNVSEKEMAQLADKVEKDRAIFNKSEEIKKSLAESVEELERLNTYVPNSADRYAWAYEYVSRRAVKTGVELDLVDEITYVGDAEKPPEEQIYEVRLSARCGYNKLVEFLWRIENGNPLVRVKDVDISTSPNGPDQQQVTLILQWPSILGIKRGADQ